MKSILKPLQFVLILVAGLLLGQYHKEIASAASGYLASGVNYDTADTAETVVYRDTSARIPGIMFPTSKTKANFDTLDPVSVGEVYFCSDCSEKLLCVSTGTSAAQFQRVDSTTIGCGTGE